MNLEIPFGIWERYHRLCRTRNDVSLHELLLALLNRTVNQRRLRDDRRGATEKLEMIVDQGGRSRRRVREIIVGSQIALESRMCAELEDLAGELGPEGLDAVIEHLEGLLAELVAGGAPGGDCKRHGRDNRAAPLAPGRLQLITGLPDAMNCIRCGAEIDHERLECLPDTVTCVSCSRVVAKQAVCDPADGEVVLLEDGEAARRARGYLEHRLYRPDAGAQ